MNALPVTLNHRNIYIIPTRYGLLFIVILIGMLIGSMNYDNNLGFLLTFFLGSLTLVSMFYTHYNLSGLTFASIRSTSVFAGQKAIFELHVKMKRTNRYSLNVRMANGDEQVIHILDNTSHVIYIGIDTQYRGVLIPKYIRISTVFPLGLFWAWTTLEIKDGCIVYPNPIPTEFKPLWIQKNQNQKDKLISIGVDDFQGLKSYQPGDPLNRIYWKGYSRGQGLFVKVFDGQIGTSVILDFMNIPDQDTERKLSKLCDWVQKSARLNLAYGLRLPDSELSPDRGDAHQHKCLKALALHGLQSPMV
ncbi:MAG: DUF58 domain-containing protein [Desulfobacterales bacterium]|nr:DUF58 domain-containing protein [Desulfobacterales bacterium]